MPRKHGCNKIQDQRIRIGSCLLWPSSKVSRTRNWITRRTAFRKRATKGWRVTYEITIWFSWKVRDQLSFGLQVVPKKSYYSGNDAKEPPKLDDGHQKVPNGFKGDPKGQYIHRKANNRAENTKINWVSQNHHPKVVKEHWNPEIGALRYALKCREQIIISRDEINWRVVFWYWEDPWVNVIN